MFVIRNVARSGYAACLENTSRVKARGFNSFAFRMTNYMVFLFDQSGTEIEMFAGTATQEHLPTEGELVAARITFPRQFLLGSTFRALVYKTRPGGKYIAAYVDQGSKPLDKS